MSKEIAMFEKFLKRLDPKDVQLKGMDGIGCMASIVVCVCVCVCVMMYNMCCVEREGLLRQILSPAYVQINSPKV